VNKQEAENSAIASVRAWFDTDDNAKRFRVEAMGKFTDRRDAARYILETLHLVDLKKTPDGVKFTLANIRAALVGVTNEGVLHGQGDARRKARIHQNR
jgi:hypothetical protein